MSENTPDSVMDTSNMDTDTDMMGLDAGDVEPSMEDILASIRQIIADDQTESLNDELDVNHQDAALLSGVAEEITERQIIETETSPDMPSEDMTVENFQSENSQDEKLDIVTRIDGGASKDTDESDILDLISFIDENKDENIEEEFLENVQTGDTKENGFGESLDLVMDADASDYLTTNVTEKTTTTLPNVDVEESVIADDLVIPDIPQEASVVAPETSQPSGDEDIDLVKSLLADLMDEPTGEESVAVKSEEEFTDLSGEMEEIFENVDTEDAPIEISKPEEAEIDFVTGLVIDNTDVDAVFDDDTIVDEVIITAEPEEVVLDDISKTPIASVQPVQQERDFVTGQMIDAEVPEGLFDDDSPDLVGEILQKSIADEVAVHEDLAVIAKDAQPETVEPEIVTEEPIEQKQDEKVEPDQIETPQNVSSPEIVEETPPVVTQGEPDTVTESDVIEDDKMSLPNIDVSSKFSLLAKTTVGISALGLGAAAALMKKERGADNNIQTEEAVVKDSEPLTKTKQDLTPQKAETEKEETMAQAEKTETMLDTDTLAGSASAFASLTSAVQEKTKLDESGPAIGDLVQDALKPMLKEWLDKNLKTIVERAVTKEVKRISSGK